MTSAGQPVPAPQDGSADRRPRQWPAYAFGVVFATVVAYVFSQAARPDDEVDVDVSSQVQDYRVINDQQLEVDVVVERDPARGLVCLIRADDGAGTEVGAAGLPVPPDPGGPRTVRLRVVVPTGARGVTGAIVGCSAVPAPSPVG